jgi:hypothetical protein
VRKLEAELQAPGKGGCSSDGGGDGGGDDDARSGFLGDGFTRAVARPPRAAAAGPSFGGLAAEARRLRRDFAYECTSLAVFWHHLEVLPAAPPFYARLEAFRRHPPARQEGQGRRLASPPPLPPQLLLPPPLLLPLGPSPPFLLPGPLVGGGGGDSAAVFGHARADDVSEPPSARAARSTSTGVHVVVQWYQTKASSDSRRAVAQQKARQAELDACLRAHLENPAVAQVHKIGQT